MDGTGPREQTVAVHSSSSSDHDVRVGDPNMKVAIVHDWLVTYAGAERVLEQMLLCYPGADLFSVIDFLAPDERPPSDSLSPFTSSNMPTSSPTILQKSLREVFPSNT